MPSDVTLSIGDTEREQTAAALGRHLALGRLTMTEFESRLDIVYAADSGGDLDAVLADLPRAAPEADPPPRRIDVRAGHRWIQWAVTAVICLLVWVVTSLAQGQPMGVWPIWVIGPWGVVLLVRAGVGWPGCGSS